MGEFTFAIGKLNTDRDGNTLPGFYTHPEKLHLGQAAGEPSPADTTPPAAQEPQQLVDTMPLHGVNIPDPNLRSRIEAHLNKKPGDTITEADMQTLTVLSVANANIRDLTGLEHATNLVWLALYNNPLSADSVERHLPALRDRGVVVDIPPSNGNGDGAEPANPMDVVDPTDPAPGEEPPRDEAFIFRKFLEEMLSARKAVYALFDYDIETIFKTPGKGFLLPSRGQYGASYAYRYQNFHMLGIFVPDVLTTTSVPQVNRFSAEYKLTREELVNLLRNLQRASIPVLLVIEVYMPDQNLREVVVAKINEQAALVSSQREVPEEDFIQIGTKKPSHPIYEPEMRIIGSLKAEAAGIESLTGLEYAINLKYLLLGNPYGRTWDLISVPLEERTEAEPKYGYRVTKPETPNQISDLTPLWNLKKLQSLDLGYNAISNLRPLAFLKNLQWLHLAENKITNISPLGSLKNLTFLSLRNDYYSPEWAGNNAVWNISPLGNLSKLETLHVDHNPISTGTIIMVQHLPKLKSLSVGCCGVSNLRPFLEHPRLGQTGGHVYLANSPLTAEDVPDLEALLARGVWVEDGIFWRIQWKDGWTTVEAIPYGRKVEGMVSKTFQTNDVENCSVSYRESLRAAPTLQSQLRTEPGVLSSLWHDLSQVPEETALLPNYPNPFNPETWIPYQLAKPAKVTVSIYAANGTLVRTLVLGHQPAGVYQDKSRAAYWDGKNTLGEPVASGVYFYTLTAGDYTATRKLLIRK